MVARAVKQITTTRWVEIEEDTGYYNDLLLQASLEEVEAIRDGLGKTLEVQPAESRLDHISRPRYTRGHLQVKGRVRHVLDDEAHLAKSSHDVVTLVLQSC